MRDSAFQLIAMYQAVTGAPPQFPAFLAALQEIRNARTTESHFALIAGSLACTAECIYRNLLDRAPTTAELAAHQSQRPFAIFSAVWNSPEFPQH